MLTFIIPCYNVEKYIEKCVYSIIDQNYELAEIYLMDDASKDRTKEICSMLSRKYTNIYLLENDRNIGGAEIRNRIINYISENNTYDERWICFLDSDDEIMNGSLKKISSIIEEIPIDDFLLFGIRFVYPDCYIDEISSLPSRNYSGNEIAHKVCSDLSWSIVSCSGNKFYRLKFIEDNKLRFRKSFAFNEDGGFAVEAFACANSVFYLDIPFYYYFQRNGSTMHSYRKDCYYTIKNVINELERYFVDKQVNGNVIIARKKIDLMYSSLVNEIAYKHQNRYKNLFEYIKSEPDSMKVCRFILKSKKFKCFEKFKAFLILYDMKYVMKILIYNSISKSKRKTVFT